MAASDILAFIRTTFPSVWTLEVLLLLRRTKERNWRIDAIVAELRSSVTAVELALTVLRAVNLISAENDTYRYAPSTAELDALVSEIADLYAIRPASVIQAIAAAPAEKLIIFANAFKLKD